MAMTKKEAAAFEALYNELRLAKALRWTEPIALDVAPPSAWGTLSKGWLYNAYTFCVEVACSSQNGHAFGSNDKTISQQPQWLYSTKKLALQAMRNEVELDAAKKLARLDAEIDLCAN